MTEIQSASPFKRFLWYHLPVILFAGLIIGVSSIPDLSPPKVKLVAVDKFAHFIEYALFAFLTFRSFSHIGRPVSLNAAYTLTLLFVSGFAWVDEYFQGFIPGRTMDPLDATADILGAVLVATFFWLRRRRRVPKQA